MKHTWYSGAKAGGLEDHQSVLQAASADPLSTDQDQRLSLEWRDLCYFLIDLQLVSVKLCLNILELEVRKKLKQKM